MKKNTPFLVGILFFAVIFSLTNCVKEQASLPKPKPPGFCDTIPAKYSADVKPIVSANCLSGCHVPAGSATSDFNQYNPLKADADDGQLRNRVIVVKDMPPAGALPDSLLQKIDCWITNGALNN